jgi:uncharacterized glyoxalase superfamily protein PhnB
MTAPFDTLRSPVEPVDPDPIFAEQLRAKLRQAVLNPLGGTMTETVAEPSPAAEDGAWGPTLSPYIVVSDARRALAWYTEVFGGTQRGELHVNPDGTIGHAEIGIGDAVLMFAEASELYPETPVAPPAAAASTHSHTLHLQVSDVDELTGRAVALGASMERPPRDQPYGRGSVIVDPFGHRWMLLKPPGRATRHRHGDVSYVTMVVADDEATKSFYGAVFGWQWQAGSAPHAWGPVGHGGAEFGIWGDQSQRPEVQLCYRVNDVETAVERVRAAGGQAEEIERRPYGLMANCVDDQDAHFQLWQPID